MKVELTLGIGSFEREIPDKYYEILRDMVLVLERETQKTPELTYEALAKAKKIIDNWKKENGLDFIL